MALQLRRGTNAQRMAITPVEGELIVVTDWEEAGVSAVWLGDGETIGGIQPTQLELNDLTDVILTAPSEGQLLFYDGTNWRNSNVITHTSSANRTVFQMDTSDAGINSVLHLRKNREGSAVATGDGAALKFQVSSNSGTPTGYALISASYSSTEPSINFGTSIDNEATDYVPQVTIGPFGLDVYRSEISLNRGQSGTPSLDAWITADRGSSDSAKIRWNETTDRWQFNNGGATYYTWPTQELETTSAPSFSGATMGFILAGISSGAYNKITTSLGDLILDANSDLVQVSGNLTVTGNLTVSGDTTTVNVSDMQVEDNTILLNRNESGAGVTLGTAGIEIERGSSTNVSWLYDESNERWAPAGTNLNIYAGGNIIAGTGLGTNGSIITINDDNGTASDCDLKVKRGPLVDAAVIRWNETTDRWTYSNADSGTFYNMPNQNLDTTSYPQFTAINLDDRLVFDTISTTKTSTAEFTLDSTTRNAIKLMVYMQRGTDSHAAEILIMRTNTSAMMTIYGEMYSTSPLASFTADQSGGSIRILATPTSATSTTFSAQRCSLT